MYQELSKDYETLEQRVIDALTAEIAKSEIESEHVDEKCINVNVFDYTELAIINDELTFMDDDGLQYSLFSECTIVDLIDILRKI